MSRITTTQDEKALFQGVCDLLNNPDNGLIDLTCNNVGIVFLRENKDALGLIKPDDMDEKRWLKLQKNWIIRPMRKQREIAEAQAQQAEAIAEEARVREREIAEAQAQQAEAIAEEARVRERVLERVLERRIGEEEDMKAFERFLGPDALAKLDPMKKLQMLNSFVAGRQERVNATEERVEGVKDKKHQRDMEKERIEMEKDRIEMEKERIWNEMTVTSQKKVVDGREVVIADTSSSSFKVSRISLISSISTSIAVCAIVA
ncbi:hypothetical protein FRACYDRAFT_232345 [Fragilariopsis cylindrus CCMP1102]|uniref:Uncharacterized protein n=1 Tax=Fragilariopsis cylindrus CCMP1102 TaxID=635003 RepID=A0A1E7FVK7_9STRA|nr:hypothetical protein FRACYDRAFT_232345 [Fragilariopsis cylindrus CCMP1102]|eukprot:OEU22191.1 hypothetical protein FRACYDRAFT_232345 [Fragilariopsis cylindrus CCMP1102]